MHVNQRLLPFVSRLTEREADDVQVLVLHATEEPGLEDARRLAERSGEQVSAHYYVDRGGLVQEWVPITRVARHARGHNQHSIGVELVNLGRFPDHFSSSGQIPTEPFPEAQVLALEDLITELCQRCPQLADIKAHSELELRVVPASDDPSLRVSRRIDPGPMFPLDRVRRHFSRERYPR